ncbi:MAG: hypothetical protein K2Q18_04005, partial [Bdellovibrionales bacterium]|nr:hypothetical protein [Bdellovibrionales bacterium]
RQECRQVPYEERECSDGPSHEVCEYVDRPHQVCENVSRYECNTVPAETVCEQIPYYENVCADETMYRSIPYACKKTIDVPYETILKTHQANVQILFDSKATEPKNEFTISLSDKGELIFAGKELKGNSALAFAKKDVKTEAKGDVNNIKGLVNVTLLDKKDLFDVSSKGISDVDLGKRSLAFVVNGKFDQKNSSLLIKIAKKDDVKFEKVLKPTQFSAKYDGSVTRVEVDLEAVGAPKLGGLFNKTHQVTLKLKVDSSALGQLVFGTELSTQTSVEVKAD